MSELFQIFLTSSLTIIGGVLIYVLGEFIKILFLDPFQKYRRTISEIDSELKYSANVICNPNMRDKNGNLPENYLKCSKRLRKLSCDLLVNYRQQLIKKLIKTSKSKIADSASRLTRLSNSLFAEGTALLNSNDIDEIRKNLNIISFEK